MRPPPMNNLNVFNSVGGRDPDAPEPNRWRGAFWTVVVAAVSAVLIAGLGQVLTLSLGNYRWALFVGTPFLMGLLPVALLRLLGPQGFSRCCTVAGLTGGLFVARMLLGRWEGLICILMALPIVLPMIAAGVVAGHELFHRNRVRPTGPTFTAAVAVFGLALTESRNVRPVPEFTAADSIVIHAAPERVWDEIVNLKAMPSPRGLLLRSGVACPRTVRLVRAGQGGVRICTLSTGQILERIAIWEPGRQLRWTSASTPPPLEELNPFGKVDAPHLHGYFETFQGEFVLEPLPGGSTRLTRRTWYRHHLAPAGYWRWWCDRAATQIHALVLQEIQRLAEATPSSLPGRNR